MEKVIWRQWFPEKSVVQLTEMGTLPRNEFEFTGSAYDGSDVAQAIAEEQNNFDNFIFAEGGKITIVEPEQWAGDYDIDVSWEPSFSANPSESD